MTRAKEDTLTFGKAERQGVRTKTAPHRGLRGHWLALQSRGVDRKGHDASSTLQAGMSQSKQERVAFYLIRP